MASMLSHGHLLATVLLLLAMMEYYKYGMPLLETPLQPIMEMLFYLVYHGRLMVSMLLLEAAITVCW